jgi:hypothetical protein
VPVGRFGFMAVNTFKSQAWRRNQPSNALDYPFLNLRIPITAQGFAMIAVRRVGS